MTVLSNVYKNERYSPAVRLNKIVSVTHYELNETLNPAGAAAVAAGEEEHRTTLRQFQFQRRRRRRRRETDARDDE